MLSDDYDQRIYVQENFDRLHAPYYLRNENDMLSDNYNEPVTYHLWTNENDMLSDSYNKPVAYQQQRKANAVHKRIQQPERVIASLGTHVGKTTKVRFLVSDNGFEMIFGKMFKCR